MEMATATITFYGSDFFAFEPSEEQRSKHDELVYSVVGNTYSFKVPVKVNDMYTRSIQDTLDEYSINLTRPAIPLVNGKPQDLRYILQPGDKVVMLFQISGG